MILTPIEIKTLKEHLRDLENLLSHMRYEPVDHDALEQAVQQTAAATAGTIRILLGGER